MNTRQLPRHALGAFELRKIKVLLFNPLKIA
jgi:hypothetical protein